MPASTDALLPRLLGALERELPAARELRERLHGHPEVAHEEHTTAAAVEAALPVACEHAAGTGLLATVGAGSARPVAVRAELDGLAIAERTGASFAATGGLMHACGHDVHMAALIALMRAAHSLRDELPAPLLAVFQPSEEAYPSGALLLAREALADRRPAAVVGAHIQPGLRWGTVAIDAGTVNASCDIFAVEVRGAPSHGAYPHLGRDPVLAIAQVVVALSARASRHIDPLSPTSITVGVMRAGSADNAIPETAIARGSLRAHLREDRAALREMLHEVATSVAHAHGCTASVEIEEGEPALENDAAIAARARALLARAGLTAAPTWRSCGSDDFAFFGELAPLAMAFVGLAGAEDFAQRPLHHPELLPPPTAVDAVARAQAVLYLAACG